LPEEADDRVETSRNVRRRTVW